LIRKKDGWIWIEKSGDKRKHSAKWLPPTPMEYWKHWGKWLIFRPLDELAELAEKVNALVEADAIEGAKYATVNKVGKVDAGKRVMCVYCDDRDRDRVFGLLAALGVTRRIWKYDHETYEQNGITYQKWLEPLLKKALKSTKLTS